MPRLLLITSLALMACTGSDDATDTEDTELPAEPTACDVLELPALAFDESSPTGTFRRDLAADFTVPVVGGGEWSLKDTWSGCESVIVLPPGIPISGNKRESWWTTDVGELIAKSPPNVTYIFMFRASGALDLDETTTALQANIDAALGELSEEDAAWWKDRLIVVSERAYELSEAGNWVAEVIRSGQANTGLAIDRFQRVRGLGSFATVENYDGTVQGWPFEAHLYAAANEAVYFNFEVERQEKLDAIDATVVPMLGGDVVEQFADAPVTFPDATTMATFDTLEIDIVMECQYPDLTEGAADPEQPGNNNAGNCGPWDYLAHMWLYDGEERYEMARFITTYRRESRWVVDASHALAWLQEGGERQLRYEWAPPWNKQPTAVTASFRLSNQGKGIRPVQAIPLYAGGRFDAEYNANRPEKDVDIPASAKKVDLVAIITGHGAETSLQCAEFCDHRHTFAVGREVLIKEHPEANSQTACQEDVANGTVPNQGGTWWFGRGGWCPGKEVIPWVTDVTDAVTVGGTTTVDYSATAEGREPNANYGTINLQSWLIVYE